MPRRLLGTSKNRRERVEGKAHGAQDARHIKSIGEHPSTAQRSHPAAQQVFRGALLAVRHPYPIGRAHLIAIAVPQEHHGFVLGNVHGFRQTGGKLRAVGLAI